MAYRGHEIGQMDIEEIMNFIISETQEEIRENISSLLIRICVGLATEAKLETESKLEKQIGQLSDKIDKVLNE